MDQIGVWLGMVIGGIIGTIACERRKARNATQCEETLKEMAEIIGQELATTEQKLATTEQQLAVLRKKNIFLQKRISILKKKLKAAEEGGDSP